LVLVVAATVLAVTIARTQSTVIAAAFEWGHPRAFHGVLRMWPCPSLEVALPDHAPSDPGGSVYPLVGAGKHGLDPAAYRHLDGMPVELQGTLIYNRDATEVELVEGSLKPAGTQAVPPPPRVSLGTVTVTGEIVDSKCHLGVMNPGRFVPHKACAIRCIRGGVPPLLVVDRGADPPLQFLLVNRDGTPVNQHVLGWVAEPVRITGEAERLGDLLVLRADPTTYRPAVHATQPQEHGSQRPVLPLDPPP
jgi:hypothetical protein